MLRDVLKGAEGLSAPLDSIAALAPDVLVLTRFDYDYDGQALRAFAGQLSTRGVTYDHLFAKRPNTGLVTGLDMDGDGRLGGPRDAQGFGWFSGQGGVAVLSKRPLVLKQDFTSLLWRDAPNSQIAFDDPGFDVQRLSSAVHWVLRVQGGPSLLIAAATPPVFDGPEDRNGRRNGDEVDLWRAVLNGGYGETTDLPVVIGNLNLDPSTGQGQRQVIQRLLDHPDLQDPAPGVPTVQWDSVGEMRVSYILPSRKLTVLDSGTMPAAPGAGPHRLVWQRLSLPEPAQSPLTMPQP